MKKTSKQSFGFSPSEQHVQNVGLLVQCEECDMWRQLFCRHKLNYQEVVELGRALDEISYTCGVSLSDLDLPGCLKNVCVYKITSAEIPWRNFTTHVGLNPYKCASEDVSVQGTSPTPRPKRVSRVVCTF